MNAKTTTSTTTETAVNALLAGGVTALANPDVAYALSVLVYRAPQDSPENCQNRKALIHVLRSTLCAEYPWMRVRDFHASFELHLTDAPLTDIFPDSFETLLSEVATFAPIPSMTPSLLVQDRNQQLVNVAAGKDHTFTVKYITGGYGTADTTFHSLADAINHIEEYAATGARKSWWKRLFG